MRVVKPNEDPVNTPEVIPAPTSSSLADVVVTLPLFAVVPVPEFDEAASKGLRVKSSAECCFPETSGAES